MNIRMLIYMLLLNENNREYQVTTKKYKNFDKCIDSLKKI